MIFYGTGAVKGQEPGKASDQGGREEKQCVVITEIFDFKTSLVHQCPQALFCIAPLVHTVFIVSGPEPLICRNCDNTLTAGAQETQDIFRRCGVVFDVFKQIQSYPKIVSGPRLCRCGEVQLPEFSGKAVGAPTEKDRSL